LFILVVVGAMYLYLLDSIGKFVERGYTEYKQNLKNFDPKDKREELLMKHTFDQIVSNYRRLWDNVNVRYELERYFSDLQGVAIEQKYKKYPVEEQSILFENFAKRKLVDIILRERTE